MKMKAALISKRFIVAGLAMALTVTGMPVSQSFGAEQSSGKEISKELTTEQKMENVIKFYGVTSLQYALIDQGKIVKTGQKGVYDKATGKLPDAQTMYGIGSLSKMFVATSMMQLVESGKIQLDEPVKTYLPEFEMADPRYKTITVRMLLNHSSGLMGSTFKDTFLLDDNDTSTHDNLLKALKTQRLKADPGAFSTYCNDGFTLAELVIERVSGKSYTAFLQENTAKPLGLSHVKTPQDDFDKKVLARTYFGKFSQATPNDNVNVVGTGGIYSTTEDLCQFSQVFMSNQGSAKAVLGQKWAAQMGASEFAKGEWAMGSKGFAFGLGWDDVQVEPFHQNNLKAVNKGGDTMLFHSSMIVLPDENMAAVVLSSGGSSMFNKVIATELLKDQLKATGKVTKERFGSGASGQGTQPATRAAMPKAQMAYNGYYVKMNDVVKVDITASGKLTVSSTGSNPVKEIYTYSSKGAFVDDKGLTQITFQKSKNGKTYLFVDGKLVFPGVGETSLACINGMKVEGRAVDKNIASAWAKRDGQRYFVVNEKYSSQVYMLEMPSLKITLDKNLPGFEGGRRLVSATESQAVAQISGLFGRDMADYRFSTQGGTEYLQTGSTLAISESAVKPLPNQAMVVFEMPKNGDALWYGVGDAAGKVLTVKLPAKASFAVYDEKGTCLNASWVTKESQVKLPQKGYVVFAGEGSSDIAYELRAK